MLVKRKPHMELDEFAAALRKHASEAATHPAMRRCTIGLARKGLYGFGEPRFDAIEVWSFDAPAEAGAAWAGAQKLAFADERYVFGMVAREHWVKPPAIR